MGSAAKTILISILSLGRPQNVLNQLIDLPAWLSMFSDQTGIRSHIVVRNNDPAADFADVAQRMRVVEATYAAITCTLITSVPNNGFGAGHNTNIAIAPSDYVLILNDDLGFPHINWLAEALQLLDTDKLTVCVGATENPRHISPAFGNGLLPGAFHLHTMSYAEASVLLFDRAAYDRLGGFGPDYHWAMCEDSDLSLRVQQHGLRLAHISMPHQHWRSTSFNSLPGQVKSSILEHNRAALFANWRESLATGRVGRYDIYDIWSDGLGDVFCALPHLLARFGAMTKAQLANIIVNTSHPELIGWLGLDGVRITSQFDLGELRAGLENEGVATLRSMRDVNFSLPFNIHALLAGALGIDPATEATRAQFAKLLQGLRLPAGSIAEVSGKYCVVHVEFDRDHEGRGLPPAVTADMLALCGTVFDTIVLVGRERRLSPALFGGSAATIIDLQGALSLSQLTAVVAHARFFVGIDSFPSHVAQACGVPAALVFGAIHPLARVWNEALTWPLTAALDCIGCYHTHLECSVPFCMRRDMACTANLAVEDMQPVLAAMVNGAPFDWQRLSLRLQALQARLIKLGRYHPAPPERLFRTQMTPNEQMSNMVYKMTEHMGAMLGNHYHTSTVSHLAARAADLQAELFAARVAMDNTARAKRIAAQPGDDALHTGLPHLTTAQTAAPHILQLASLRMNATRCTTERTDQWIDVEAFDEDPQLHLQPVRGSGGKVQLRLSCIVDATEALQVYWSTNGVEFSAERVHTIPSAGGLQTTNLAFAVAPEDVLHIRIDPTTGEGRSRLRGTLSGMFELDDEPENPVSVAVQNAEAIADDPACAAPELNDGGASDPEEHRVIKPLRPNHRRARSPLPA